MFKPEVETIHPILRQFDPVALARGRQYFADGHVLHLRFDSRRLIAHVQGSGRPSDAYGCAINFDPAMSRVIYNWCACPVGSNCKHVCAALLAFLSDRRLPEEFANRRVDSTSTQVFPPIKNKDMPTFSASLADIQPQLTKEQLALKNFTRAVDRLSESINKPKSHSTDDGPRRYKTTELIYVLKVASWDLFSHIEPLVAYIKRDGNRGNTTRANWDTIARGNAQYISEEDSEIADLAVLFGERHWRTRLGEVNDNDFQLFLRLILRTGRCHLESPNGIPLREGRPLPGTFCWETCLDQTARYALEVTTDEGEKLLAMRWRTPWYVNQKTGECGPVIIDKSADIVDSIFSLPSIPCALLEGTAIPEVLATSNLDAVLPMPAQSKRVRIERVKPTPTMEVTPAVLRFPICTSPYGSLAYESDVLKVMTVTNSSNADDGGTSTFVDSDGTTVIRKLESDSSQEHEAILKDLGFVKAPANAFEELQPSENHFVGEPEAWLRLSERLNELEKTGWQFGEKSQQFIRPIELSDSDLEFEVESDDGDWWFSLALHILVDGKKVPLLPLLISALRSLPHGDTITESIHLLNHDGKFYAELPNGQIASMPFQRIEPILVSMQELIWKYRDDEETLDVSALHLEELLNNQFLSAAKWLGADRIQTLIAKLGNLKNIERVAAPKQFEAKLRDYQVDGLSWLNFLGRNEFGGILADDMGLGKTVELLAHIALEKENGRLKKPFLIVCPTSVAPNWLSEIRKFTPHLSVVSYTGPDRFLLTKQFESNDIVITTYPLIGRDKEVLNKIAWHGVALDEAQAIKKPETQVAVAVRSLKAKQRFCLTGTPVENHLGELWSQFQFLLPGLLGDRATFKQVIQNPIEKYGHLGTKARLAHRIRPFVLRRKKEQVASELPPKTVIVKYVDMAEGQRDLYETVRLAVSEKVRKEIADKGFKHSQIMILDALLKLRQACCDPRLVKLTAARKTKKSAKRETLIEMVQELLQEDRRILLFSQFTSMLDILAEELDGLGIPFVQLRGDTKDRKTPVDRFQSGDVSLFLISLKAGGTGLNLTAADTVIHYDPWWNPAVEDQATDRAHRIGQDKNVFVYKLIAKDTIEQRMLELQERKRVLADSIYDERGNLSLSFSEDDLTALLAPLAE